MHLQPAIHLTRFIRSLVHSLARSLVRVVQISATSVEFLGQHIVQLEETHLTGQFSEWIPLRARGDPSDGPITGDIFIAFSKVTDGPPPSPQPEARDSPPTERASLTSSCQSAGSSSSSSSSSTSSSLAPSPKAKHRRRHSSGNDDIVPDASPSPSQPTGLSPSISARLQGITGFKKKFGTVESRVRRCRCCVCSLARSIDRSLD